VYTVGTLGLPPVSVGVLFGVCSVVLIAAQPLVPRLLDRLGDERAVRTGLGLYAAVPIGCLVSLVAGRLGMGPSMLTGLLVAAMVMHACGELLERV
jgi:MFS family permease